jgi:hypothetical protein
MRLRPTPDSLLAMLWRAPRLWLAGWLFCVSCLVWGAEETHKNVVLERTPEGLYLSARLPVSMPSSVEEVLLRGVPLHFVWRADVRRERWYWADATLASRSRWVRLAYQPLTRRWRVSVSQDAELAGAGAVNALHQNLDSLEQALAVVKRVTRWRIATSAELGDGENTRVEFDYRLDAGLLPRPFQIGQGDAAAWGLVYRQTLPLPPVDAPPRTDWLGETGSVEP